MKINKYLVINADTMDIVNICDSLKGARSSMANGVGQYCQDRCSVVKAELIWDPREILAFDPNTRETNPIHQIKQSSKYKDQITDKTKMPADLIMKYDLNGW